MAQLVERRILDFHLGHDLSTVAEGTSFLIVLECTPR